jgi:hypothetical protein
MIIMILILLLFVLGCIVPLFVSDDMQDVVRLRK